ncbi:biotin-dependent carboxyltransferase family protein [Sporosarcina sp. FA9]|uniref:5-oxoprolinase subunit C family protein n=1 Tax=Sporosarcina sp. FA9 TaxID=3413030 RepID=UPI003F657DFA
MIPLFQVIQPGVYSSIQDIGRTGYRRFGMPVSGPMDQYAFQLGMEIAANEETESALELFLGGLTLKVLMDHRITLVGADLTAMIDDARAPMWKSFYVWKGQTLRFVKPKTGSIAYIIPEGGFYAAKVLGSQSAYPKGKIGVVVTKGSILYVNTPNKQGMNRGLVVMNIPQYKNNIEVEVWTSPHLDLFKEVSVQKFFSSAYTMRGGDRMGYFITGSALEFKSSADIISESTQFGTIQVPTSGQPIILMADAQTVGGYATIGKIVKDDLSKVAQLRTGGTIRFSMKVTD